ncbi:zinc metallopeptidase [Candidatus Acetothermia bacterium]|nr:zinc metallopeptidase [Candidatus Acetothermia bacterium]
MSFPLLLLLALIALTAGFWTNFQISTLMRRYSRVRTPTWVNVSNLATELLAAQKIASVKIEPLSSMVDDHYDVLRRRLRLSDPTGYSIAEFAMTAQETGLVIQQAQNPVLFWPFWGLAALAKLAATVAAIGILVSLLQWVPFFGLALLRALPENLTTLSLFTYMWCVLATLPMASLRWQTNLQTLPLLKKLPEMKSEPSAEEMKQLAQMMNTLVWRDLKDVALVLPGIITSIKDWLTQPRR